MLRGYFALLEGGSTCLPTSELTRHLVSNEHAALREAGLSRPDRPLVVWPCDRSRRECGREVMESAPASAKPFVAVCEGEHGDDDPCPAVALTAEDLAQEAITVGDLARGLRRIYRLEDDAAAGRLLAPHADPAPIPLGAEAMGDVARDVFLVLRPGDAAFPLFLAARERAARSTLVLVPTARRVPAEMATRYGPGGHVEIEVLEDVIAVRDGKLARTATLRLVSSPPATASTPVKVARPEKGATAGPVVAVGLAAQLGATAWKDLKITAIDGHTVRIQCGKVTMRRSYLDLGFGGEKRDPIKKWQILLAICAGHGSFRWKHFGDFDTAKNAVSVVQRLLKKAFGLRDNPLHAFSAANGWKAKFFASSEIADAD